MPSPIRGLLSAILLLLATGACYLFHRLLVPVLFIALCFYLLAARFVEWVKANRGEAIEALYGGLPFLLILLAVFQLK